MATPQDFFNKSQQAYRKAEKLIMKLSVLAKAVDKNFDANVPLKQYDLMLQAILFYTITADGKIRGVEASFVKQITDHADILEILREKAGMPIDWSILGVLDEENAKNVANICGKLAVEIGESFIKCFALIDAAIEDENFIEELTGYTTEIISGAMIIDGDTDIKETLASFASMKAILQEPWEKYKSMASGRVEQAKASSSSNDRTSSVGGNSLKDAYLKKKQLNQSSEYRVNASVDKKHIVNYVVYIETESGSGSGFVITEDGYAVTCAHVVRGCSELFVKLNLEDGSADVASAEVVSISNKYDIAIIKIEDGTSYFAELDMDRSAPDLGEEIAIYGYPFGKRMNDDVMSLNISMAKGYISSNQRIDGVDKSLLDISAKSGNSGSPIISLENGKVIGILSGSIVNGGALKEEVNYMINIKYINELLEE